VGKSTFQFQDIQKIFKVGYQSAFMGCFCDCHFVHNDEASSAQLRGQEPFLHLQRLHPVFPDMPGEQPASIVYQDDQGMNRTLNVHNLYQQERILPQEKCDSILTKIIYSQAQFKAAEDNAL